MKVDCPLCGNPAKSAPPDFHCTICGQFKMSFELQLDRDIKGIGDPALKVALSAATRQENFFRNGTLRLTPENYRSHAETHRWTPVSQKFQMVLEAARKSSAQFGAKFTLTTRTILSSTQRGRTRPGRSSVILWRASSLHRVL